MVILEGFKEFSYIQKTANKQTPQSSLSIPEIH